MSIQQNFPAVQPSLNLNFARSKTLDPRITFSRSSTATRTNSKGLIETVSADVPRFEHLYNPSTGSVNSLGLLIEESKTNLLQRSEEFNTSPNQVSNSSITANATTSPDGTLTADKLVENSSTGNKEVYQFLGSLSASTNYTISVFAKASERTRFRMSFDTALFGTFSTTHFDLSNGTIISNVGSVVSSSIIPYPNGWYRCTSTVLTVNTTNTNAYITLIQSGTTTGYTGDGVSGIFIWGFQVEQSAYATSYIPTVASTVTRSADNASITGTNFSNWYNQSEGTLFASIRNQTVRSSLTYDRFVSLCGNDVNNDEISIYTQTASGGGAQNKFLGGIAVGGVAGLDGGITGLGPDNIGKAIIAYKTNDSAFNVSGGTTRVFTSVSLPTCTSLQICSAVRYQNKPTATIQQILYYPKRLTDTQLQTLTR